VAFGRAGKSTLSYGLVEQQVNAALAALLAPPRGVRSGTCGHGASADGAGEARAVDITSNRSYRGDMRASTHISAPPRPDYALRVPSHLLTLVALGLFGGALGVGLLVAAPSAPPLLDALLLLLALLSAAFGLGLGVIISPRLRRGARRRMLEAVSWRGDEQVLDVGCGNGFLLVAVAKRLTSGHVTGIDVWRSAAGEQTAEGAWRNARLEGVAERVEIKNIDARATPFSDQSFDVIVSSLMLHHAGGAADRERVLCEMARVLKPGGTLLLYDVAPLIGGAARTLHQLGLGSIQRRGWLIALLLAHGRVKRAFD
jgi:SAM-dependent methyltransferase